MTLEAAMYRPRVRGVRIKYKTERLSEGPSLFLGVFGDTFCGVLWCSCGVSVVFWASLFVVCVDDAKSVQAIEWLAAKGASDANDANGKLVS